MSLLECHYRYHAVKLSSSQLKFTFNFSIHFFISTSDSPPNENPMPVLVMSRYLGEKSVAQVLLMPPNKRYDNSLAITNLSNTILCKNCLSFQPLDFSTDASDVTYHRGRNVTKNFIPHSHERFRTSLSSSINLKHHWFNITDKCCSNSGDIRRLLT